MEYLKIGPSQSPNRSIRPDTAVRMSLSQIIAVVLSIITLTATVVFVYSELDGRIRRLEERTGIRK